MTAAEAFKAILWPTPDLKERILDSSGFAADGRIYLYGNYY